MSAPAAHALDCERVPEDFTVLGIWDDTDQRFADFVIACCAEAAEDDVRARMEDVDERLRIAGVIRGTHECADTRTHGWRTAEA